MKIETNIKKCFLNILDQMLKITAFFQKPSESIISSNKGESLKRKPSSSLGIYIALN